MRSRLPYPKKIANAPKLELGDELFYEAWVELASCRYYEGGPIPWAIVLKYADELELFGDQRDALFIVIREVDEWFLAHMAKKRTTKPPPEPAGPKTKVPKHGR